MAYFEQRGFVVHTLEIVPNDGRLSIAQAAQQVLEYIARFPEQVFVFIGFSMGGIIARYVVQQFDVEQQVKKIVTIGSPHHGTLWAYFFQRPGIQDMRLGSPLLRELNKDVDSFKKVPFLSLWTPFDVMIIPATSSIIPFACMHIIYALSHLGLLRKSSTYTSIEKFLFDAL